jgi:hypothetical protein
MSRIFDVISSWKFDPITFLLTVVVLPTLAFILFRVRKFAKQAFGHLLDGIVYTLNKTVAHRVAAHLTLKRYSKLQLAGSTKTLRIPASVEISIEIDKIFVPLTLQNQGLSLNYSTFSLLEAGTRIRIIGDPGSGKSSAAKKLFREACRRVDISPVHSRFPIFLELRNLEIPKSIAAGKLGDWLLNHLKASCASYDVYNLEQCFDAYANKTGLLIILDGLDEVSSSLYQRVAMALNALSTRLHQLGEHNAIVLTLRSQFHQQVRADFEDSFPAVLSVKRFSPADIFEFLSRWPFPTQHFENAVRIYNDLTDRPSLREMCTNPLVLSMYVAQDQISGHQAAPDSRTAFYSKVTEELLIKRRARQIGASNSHAVVRDQRERILGKIAFDHLCDPDQSPNHLSWSNAIEIVGSVVGSKTSADASTYLRDLAKETGLISEEQYGESFRFIHLTFCEYFCAYEAVHSRLDGWASLLSSHRRFQHDAVLKSRLVEALPFATALLPRHMRAGAVEQVWKCDDLHLAAMTFLETKNYAHGRWQEFVDGNIARLEQIDGRKWSSDELRELHLFLVVASDAERWSHVKNVVQTSDAVLLFFRKVAAQQADSLSTLIMSYAEQDAVAALRVASLCQIDLLNEFPQVIVSSCDQPPFVAMALERARREIPLANLWASFFAEGGLRSRAAAVTLSNVLERPWQKTVAREVPAEMRWSNFGMYRNSFFLDCLSLGCHANLGRAETPLLNILATIPPPNISRRLLLILTSKTTSLLAFILLMIASIAVSALAIVTALKEANKADTALSAGFCLIIVFGWVAALQLAASYRQRVYQVLLNERPSLAQVLIRGLFASYRSKQVIWDLMFAPRQTDENGDTEWAQYMRPGLFRSSDLIEKSRQLILKRESLSANITQRSVLTSQIRAVSQQD